MDEKIYTVTVLTNTIKNILMEHIPFNIKVMGEISNYKLHSSGHLYFSLKDDNAVIKAVMFSAKNKLKEHFNEGDKVIVMGNISVYPPHGSYQIIVNTIEKYGQGELYKKFLEIKKKLQEKGLFDNQHKKELPNYPMRIGIITSETGAVIRDIYNVLNRRAPYIEKFLYPAKVQGENAHKTLIKGIEYFNNIKNVDIIIIGRGGGSIEDLWEFNNEKLAETVFNSNIPIISAVGHETDFTIIDFVADKRAPTPSAAAEIAVKDIKDIMLELNEYKKNMKRNLKQSIIEIINLLNSLKKEFYIISTDIINNNKQILSELNIKMEKIINNKTKDIHNSILVLKNKLLKNSPERKYQLIGNDIKNYKGLLYKAIIKIINEEKQRIRISENAIKHLNPLSVLNRGYSIVYDENNDIIKSHKDIEINEKIRILLKDGQLFSKVFKKESKNGRKES